MEPKKYIRSIPEVANKWRSGTATPEDKEFYEQWYASFDDSTLEMEGAGPGETDQLGAKMYAKLMLKIEQDNKRVSFFRPYAKWIGTAAAILVLALGYWAYHSGVVENISYGYMAKSQSIVPGKRTATLKLSNGQIVQLKENKEGLIIDAESLSYADGSDLAFSKESLSESKEMILSTPKGGTYQVVLPDGSKVWLNAQSSISLPADFAKRFDRRVVLKGEAYFEISKSEATVDGKILRRPFVVAVDNKSVEVLGTHFNIKSYTGELGMKTTLLEGSVKVVSGAWQKTIVPGQQALALNSGISTANVDLEEVVAWKNGNFQFTDQNIKQIMQEIGRWYNVEVVYQGTITQESFGGTISRSKPITEVLASLEETGAVHFKIEGRRVVVMP